MCYLWLLRLVSRELCEGVVNVGGGWGWGDTRGKQGTFDWRVCGHGLSPSPSLKG